MLRAACWRQQPAGACMQHESYWCQRLPCSRLPSGSCSGCCLSAWRQVCSSLLGHSCPHQVGQLGPSSQEVPVHMCMCLRGFEPQATAHGFLAVVPQLGMRPPHSKLDLQPSHNGHASLSSADRAHGLRMTCRLTSQASPRKFWPPLLVRCCAP